MAFVIQSNQDGEARYFAPDAGRRYGAPGGGWVERAVDAIAFVRDHDAQRYLEHHLPHMQHICTIAEKDIAA